MHPLPGTITILNTKIMHSLSSKRIIGMLCFYILSCTMVLSQPSFTSPSSITINEDSTKKFVATVSATGVGPITYSLSTGASGIAGPDTSSFRIDKVTGDLSFIFFPDYERPRGRNLSTSVAASVSNIYKIAVMATDGNIVPLTKIQNITITVANVDENPDPPRDLFVISQNQSNILKWTASAATGTISEYHIYRSEDSITWIPISIGIPLGTTTFTDNSLVNGKFYFYAVRAWNGVKESVNSNVDASTPWSPQVSSYMHFDGSTSYLVASDSSKLLGMPKNLGTTMECWVRFKTLPTSKTYILSRDYNLPNPYIPGNGSTILRWYSIYFDPIMQLVNLAIKK